MSKTLDNIGTVMAPTWRARRRKPFTCHAVRMQLVAQAADLPEWERVAYIDARLSDLDRALDGDQAESLERWLDCEELLQGRPASVGDGGGGGSGRSLLPDDVMEALAEHAGMKRRLAVRHRSALGMLATMMQSGEWTLTDGFVSRTCAAAAELTKIARVHAQQIAQPLTKSTKSSSKWRRGPNYARSAPLMARTHGLDKRLEEQRMTSTQKQPKHHSYSSSTQDSVNTGGSGAPGKPYKSGVNVHKGAGPKPGKGGVSAASKPKQKGY